MNSGAYPDLETFKSLASQGNLVPIYREIVGDLETPVTAYLKVAHGSTHSFLLESVEQGGKVGRYSFIGADPAAQIVVDKAVVRVVRRNHPDEIIDHQQDPLAVLRSLLARYRPVELPELPLFTGGAVGFLSYDMIRFFEGRVPDNNPPIAGVAEATFLVTDSILIFDHLERKIKVVANAHIDGDPEQAYLRAEAQISALIAKLQGPLPARPRSGQGGELRFSSNMTKAEYKAIVGRAQEYIRAGDIFQVVLSQRFEAEISAPPFDLYRALRMVNPSSYMYFFHLGDIDIAGSSPEVLVRCEQGHVELRPIAGTRPRGRDSQHDQELLEELLADPKELAEHIMLVDLGRNDIGRVCRYGSVQITEMMVIEKYSHVMHIVSNIIGELLPKWDIYDLVRATFPAGTLSGSPKIRAMEIVDELETVRRGIYGGGIGYFGFSGDLDICIVIRTALIKAGRVYIQAGAGIVADSVAENEYQETVNKAQGLMDAVRLAEEGLV